MNDFAIHIENLDMKFRLATEKIDTAKEFFIRKLKNNITYDEFYALKDINLEIGKGERIGIIGYNGAGKSTLLKIICGVMKPTAGQIRTNGRIVPLLELGAGFDGEFTGRENIYLNAAILGKKQTFIEARINDIIDFAELGDFIDVAVKNYSSGMRAKLGFSIATQIEPDILLLDEILAVGDINFKKKSEKKMMELINGDCTVVLVSHNLNTITTLTDKVVWLEKGKIVMIDESKRVCRQYQRNKK